MTLWYDLTGQPSEDETRAVRDGLWGFNAESGFAADRRPLALLLRDAQGTVIGGLIGHTGWSWLYIETLAIPAAQRGGGWGSRLMRAALAEAVRRGCIGARVDTYSFQARGFYEKLDFSLTGQLDDCPPGQIRYSLAKRLDAPPTAAEPWPDAAAPRVTITETDAVADPARAVILAGLSRHAEPLAGPSGHAGFNLVVRGPDSPAPIGGLTGFFLYGWLHIHLFHLPEALRGQGLGRALMARAEAAARARGCAGICLDTFSFQARPFYERLGFVVFGSIAEFPPGHSRHYLMKRLDHGEA